MQIRRDPGLVAAAVLAVVTLTVFGVFQNYGPESAVRRFHHAVAHNDLGEMAQVVTQGVDSTAVTQLVSIVKSALAKGSGYYRILTSDRSERQVVMLARYEGARPIVWVVVKARDRWRVDPYLTLQALRRLGY
ncbi:hypothetical protein EON82_06870 [bacterium]|nr:MAG: hypothetical protein EON82_06870 [bacterium]